MFLHIYLFKRAIDMTERRQFDQCQKFKFELLKGQASSKWAFFEQSNSSIKSHDDDDLCLDEVTFIGVEI